MAIELSDGDAYLTTAEVCEILNCHRTTLNNHLDDPTWPKSFRYGHKRLYRRSAIYGWLAGLELAGAQQ
jgi:excisionase family DNA binding protein